LIGFKGVMVISYKKILEFFGYNSGPVAALDISNTSVKILQLSRLGAIITIDHYAIEPLNNIIDATSVITAIKAAILKSGIKTKKTCISIGHEKVITKIITMAAVLDDKDIGNEIELEASKYIPYPIADMSIDYMVLKPQQNNSDTVDVLLVASKSAYVHDITSLVIAAGLQPVIVDVDTYAIARAFEFVTKNSLTANCNKIFAIF
jgi:type IV pilus assembly protein PilM